MTSSPGDGSDGRSFGPSLDRRRFLGFVAAGAAGLGLAACGAQNPAAGDQEGRVVSHGIRYRYGPAARQIAELLLPPGVERRGPRLPVMALFHGGAWEAGGQRQDVWPLARALSRRGYAVWNVDYRTLGTGEGGGWPNTYEDAASAVDLLDEVATRWPIDPGSVLSMGVSAGGTLAAWTAARSGLPKGAVGSSPEVVAKGAISCAGVLDLAWYAHGGDGVGQPPPEAVVGAVIELMGGMPEAVPQHYELGSPIERLPFHVPSIVAQGADDLLVLPAQARRFVDRAHAVGDDCQYLLVDDAGHDAWSVPSSPALQRLLAVLPAFAERAGLEAQPRP